MQKAPAAKWLWISLSLLVPVFVLCVFRPDPIGVPTAFDHRSDGEIREHG
jgi:hypothetical protein